MARFGTYSENTSPADADLLVSVDVSDTTDDATGSTKRLSLSGLRTFFGAIFAPLASPTFTGTTTTAALTATGVTIVPAATAATHAAQVSARDATYGQLAIGGVEMGDTGWRDVTADAAAALTAGTIRMKRHGNTVHVSLLGTKMAVNTTYYTLPTGFGIDNYSGMYYSFSQLARSAASVNTVWMRSIGQALHISSHTGTWNASGDYLNASFSFETQNAWPTTLPGTQITAPA